MRLYIACLAAYTEGTLHGTWVDPTKTDLSEAIEEVLASSPVPGSEEWAVHDYDGIPSSFAHALGEYPDLEFIDWLAAQSQREEFEAACLYSRPDEIREALEQYIGKFDQVEDYAFELVEEMGFLKILPESMRCYFDYRAYARDLLLSGDIWEVRLEGSSYLFHCI